LPSGDQRVRGRERREAVSPAPAPVQLAVKQRGKARREQRQQETFAVRIDGRKRYVPAADYPGIIVSFVFPYPTILLGIEPTLVSFSGGVAVGTLPEFGERLNALRAKYSGREVAFLPGGSAEAVGRLLAKVAHSYAVAELGLDAFRPYLLGIIRNQDPMLMHHLIGSATGEAPVSEDMHDIEILPPEALGSGKLVVVRFHLFANLKGMPVHYVVAGER
jgi:hypothetical protein